MSLSIRPLFSRLGLPRSPRLVSSVFSLSSLFFFYHPVKLRFRVPGIGTTRARYYLVFIVLVKSVCARRCIYARIYLPTGSRKGCTNETAA